MHDRDEAMFEDGFTPMDDGFTPVEEDAAAADESMPRRAALGMAGGLAALAALGAGTKSAGAQTAQAVSRGGLARIRQVIDSARIPNNSNRVVRLVCPNPRRNERVYVMGGGFNHTTNNPNFVIKTNAPDTTRSWIVDGHNLTGGNVTLGAYAICAYFRR